MGINRGVHTELITPLTITMEMQNDCMTVRFANPVKC